MKKNSLATLLIVTAFLSGCASTVSRNTSTIKEEKVQISKFQEIKTISLTLNSKAKDKLPDNASFNPDALLKRINSTFLANQYLSSNTSSSNVTIEVTVTNIRVRSGVSAIMLGILAGGDYINGDVIVKDGNTVIDKFEVDITYALGGAMGDTDTRMNWMYESFANKMMEEIKKLFPKS